MRRLPPLNALRAFEAAARHLSFTKAAAELYVTQAAISHQVKALEEWLSLALFRRRNRGLILTDAGQAYLPALREAFDILAAATGRLQKQDETGALNISAFSSFAAKWLVPKLGSFAERHPDIDVRISASDAIIDLEQESFDLAIRYGRGDWPGLVCERFMTEDIFVVCSPALLQGAEPLVRPADLSRYTLLHDHMREDWHMWLEAAGIRLAPRRSLDFSHSNMVLQAAIDGLGVALGRSVLVADDLAAGRLVKPFDLALHAAFAYYVVYPQRSAARRKVKAFRDWLFETAGQFADPAARG